MPEAEVDTSSEEVTDSAAILITVTESTVKYDTNLPIPEMLFWMDVVKSMAIQQTVGTED